MNGNKTKNDWIYEYQSNAQKKHTKINVNTQYFMFFKKF